jgi:hypothetical protein
MFPPSVGKTTVKFSEAILAVDGIPHFVAIWKCRISACASGPPVTRVSTSRHGATEKNLNGPSPPTLAVKDKRAEPRSRNRVIAMTASYCR